jgi:hypothetical protein
MEETVEADTVDEADATMRRMFNVEREDGNYHHDALVDGMDIEELPE